MNDSTNGKPIDVAIAGLGRSGWKIHADALSQLPEQYRVVAVLDPVESRCAEARERFGCRVAQSYEALIADDAVELVVVASPNLKHVEHTIAAVEAGRHVVCEKPLAMSAEEADRSIEAAERCGRVLAPFQNRRYEPHFLKVKEVIESGRLGRILQVRLAWHGFSRRWDWQTLREFGGGSLNNNGPHLVDQALQLFGEEEEPQVFCDLQRGLSSGDAEDHVKIVLRGERSPTIDVELTSVCAYGDQSGWLVMGTAGGLKGHARALEWKWVDWSAMPERPVEREPTSDRTYNREELTWQTERWEAPAGEPSEAIRFYRDLYQTIREGSPLYITPRSVRRQLAVLERCREAAGEVVGVGV